MFSSSSFPLLYLVVDEQLFKFSNDDDSSDDEDDNGPFDGNAGKLQYRQSRDRRLMSADSSPDSIRHHRKHVRVHGHEVLRDDDARRDDDVELVSPA